MAPTVAHPKPKAATIRTKDLVNELAIQLVSIEGMIARNKAAPGLGNDPRDDDNPGPWTSRWVTIYAHEKNRALIYLLAFPLLGPDCEQILADACTRMRQSGVMARRAA